MPVQPRCTADGDEAVLSLKALLQTEVRSAIDPKPEQMNSAVIGIVRVFAGLIASLLDAAKQLAEAEEKCDCDVR